MKRVQWLLAAAVAMTAMAWGHAAPTSVFVNEIHYDNVGTDVGEFIEIAGPAGADLTGWTIVLYNGANQVVYGTTPLAGPIPDQQNGFGTVVVSYPSNGLQIGAPDGIALVDDAGAVVLFLSCEGTFTAADGPAAGLTSTDIGVSEGSSTLIGQSLQLWGNGTVYEDFSWTGPVADSPGLVNGRQTFAGPANVPEPGTLALLGLGIVGLARRGRRKASGTKA